MKDTLLGYLRINTQSNPSASSDDIKKIKQHALDAPGSKVITAANDCPRVPTSAGQFALANRVAHQLESIGCDVTLDSNAILIARLAASCPTDTRKPLVIFAHLDTAGDQSGDVNPQVVHYQGGDISLSSQHILSPTDFPELLNYIGDDIVVTDGTSLLGADDKAAITAAVQCLREIANKPHREVKVVLVPDEEIGLLGAKALDVAALDGEYGICLDCCGIGEYVVNNWNAGKARVTFAGRSAHPMNAKNNLKNAVIMAQDFIGMLPAAERPEHTEGEEGYFWVKGIQGDTVHTSVDILIRDFFTSSYEARKAYLQKAAELIETKYGSPVTVTLEDDYPSISDLSSVSQHGPTMAQVQAHVAATLEQHGITPVPLVMRGGYDGCIISKKGLPTVNLFTGAHNFHSIHEYQPLGSLTKAIDVLVSLATATSDIRQVDTQ